MAAHIRPNDFCDVKAGGKFRLYIVQHSCSSCYRQGPVYSRWRRIMHCHWYTLQALAWDAALIKADLTFTDDSWSLFHGRVTHHCISTAYLNAISNELWPTLVFLFMWPLHLSFAVCFSNMPYFRQSLSRNAIMKFYQKWYTYRKILRVDAWNGCWERNDILWSF